jgi:hypothetical protein
MRTIRIDFCDFYVGFNKTNNFFHNLLKQQYNVEICDKPDFLIYSQDGDNHKMHNCVKIYFTVENYAPDWNQCDYAFTCRYLEDPRHLRFPLYVWYGGPHPLLKHKDNLDSIMAEKSRFCSFVVSNKSLKKTQKRIEFFKTLTTRKQVDSAGSFLNNVGYSIPHGSGEKVKFLRSYKFNIAFENASIPGYTTEKLYEAMQARCIPIYWGNPRISEEFNTKSFLNYQDFASEEALIERILELDQDPAKYRAMMAEPYFVGNTPNPYFSHERILKQFETIFTKQITPVARKGGFWNGARWAVVKRAKEYPISFE